MNSELKKILLAVDGSEQSLEAVRYISDIFPFDSIKVVLFHVLSNEPEVFHDLGRESKYAAFHMGKEVWKRAMMDTMKRFMGEARRILLAKGVPEKEIIIKIQKKKAGIARDIFAESIHGYSMVVVGRCGTGKFKDLVIGSIADKLVERLSHVTICAVGDRPKTDKLLLALDESEGAMRAVDFVGSMLCQSSCAVTLFHVLRGLNVLAGRFENLFDPAYEKKWIAAYEIESLFEEAKMHLVGPGVSPDRLSTKLVPGASSRGGAIVKELLDAGHGTVVVGRRGLSNVREFSMGRVTNKVVQLAKENAVWVIK